MIPSPYTASEEPVPVRVEPRRKSFSLTKVRPAGHPIGKNYEAEHYIRSSRKNPLIQAVEATILTDLANTRWVKFDIVYDDESGEKAGQRVENPLATSWRRRLNIKANAHQPAATFRYQTGSRLLTTGEAYATIFDTPSEVLALQPMLEGAEYRAIPAQRGQTGPDGTPLLIVGYAPFDANGHRVGAVVPADKVFRPYLPDENDPFRPVSPLASAGLPANVVQAALELQQDVLDNHGAAPALILEENIDDDELAARETHWGEKSRDPQYRGMFRFMGVNGPVHVIPGPTAQDIGSLASFTEATNLVLAAYRVPKSAMGLVTGETYSNAETGLRDYVERCVAFWAGVFATAVTQHLPDGWECVVDLSEHPGMQDDADAKAERFKAAYLSRAVYTNEYRKALGLEPVDEELNTLGPESTYISPMDAVPSVDPNRRASQEGGEPEGKAIGPSEARTKAAARIVALWDAHVDDTTAMLESDIAAYFERQQRGVYGALADAWAETAQARALTVALDDARQKDVSVEAAVTFITDRVFDLNRWNRELREDAPRWFRPVMRRTQRYLANAFAIDAEGDTPGFREILDRRAQKIVEINDTTRELIRYHVLRSYRSGESIDKLRRRLEPVFNRKRAQTIARTETLAISNQAIYAAYAHKGIEEHEWLSAGDGKVRPSHQISGEIRRIGERFSNGLLHPHDPSADADEVINCRCTTAPVATLL